MEFSLEKFITNSDWSFFFEKQYKENYWKKLKQNLAKEQSFYPPAKKIFQTFNILSPQNIKIVILGQDPYHQKNQADGLAFSTQNAKLPASLKNIFKEVFGERKISGGDLSKWVTQGVFLLNRILTVQDSKPLSHKNFGWQEFTQQTLIYLDQSPKCFMLWGKEAQEATKFLKNKNHCILKTSHPSPLSVYRGFAGCKHFQKANQWLQSRGQSPIVWEKFL
jgi:uracil-DNA glycosylase